MHSKMKQVTVIIKLMIIKLEWSLVVNEKQVDETL